MVDGAVVVGAWVDGVALTGAVVDGDVVIGFEEEPHADRPAATPRPRININVLRPSGRRVCMRFLSGDPRPKTVPRISIQPRPANRSDTHQSNHRPAPLTHRAPLTDRAQRAGVTCAVDPGGGRLSNRRAPRPKRLSRHFAPEGPIRKLTAGGPTPRSGRLP